MIISSIEKLIGNTPLLDVSALLPKGSARLFTKLEMLNPGGSIKDRPALAMVDAAEKDGLLKPGMTIVEPTAGNTGIGLALVGNLRGYRTVFFVPDRMSMEKINTMRLYGAKVVLVPKEKGMTGCIDDAKAYCDSHPGCYMPQQFDNEANPNQAEYILGAEIANQLGAYPDGLAIGAGTGGTFSGLSRWLKKANPQAICHLVQPEGSIFDGSPKGTYEIEGIGNSFIPNTLDLSLADAITTVPDPESFASCQLIGQKTGLLVGGSSGANFWASAKLCKALGEGKTVVTIFPDNIERYHSKQWVKDLAGG